MVIQMLNITQYILMKMCQLKNKSLNKNNILFCDLYFQRQFQKDAFQLNKVKIQA